MCLNKSINTIMEKYMRSHVKFNKKINCLVIKSPSSIEKNVVTVNLSNSQNVSYFCIDKLEENNTRFFGLFYENLTHEDSIRVLTFNSIEDAQECKNKIDKELMRRTDKMSVMKGVVLLLATVLLLKIILLPNNSLSLADNLSNEVNSASNMNNILQQYSQEQLANYMKSKKENNLQENKSENFNEEQSVRGSSKQSADDLEKLLNSSK